MIKLQHTLSEVGSHRKAAEEVDDLGEKEGRKDLKNNNKLGDVSLHIFLHPWQFSSPESYLSARGSSSRASLC